MIITNTLELMEDERYAELNALVCPVCRGEEIYSDDGQVSCENCFNVWEEKLFFVRSDFNDDDFDYFSETGNCPACNGATTAIEMESGKYIDEIISCSKCQLSWDIEREIIGYKLLTKKFEIKQKGE